MWNVFQDLRRTSLIALSYAIVGAGGLWLASPGAFASPIFPCAGLALAVAIVYGRQGVLGIFIGGFGLYVVATSRRGLGLPMATLTALCMAAGAAAQSWLGKKMV